MTDHWLFVECIPHIRTRFPQDNRLCRVLALATLWAAFDVDATEYLDPTHADRIRTDFARVAPNWSEGNPVEKKAIMIVRTQQVLA